MRLLTFIFLFCLFFALLTAGVYGYYGIITEEYYIIAATGIVIISLGLSSMVAGMFHDIPIKKVEAAMERVLAEYDEEEYEDEEPISEQPQEIAEPIPEHPALSHVLLYGGAGQGKTALSNVSKNELAKAYGHDIDFIEVVPSQLKRKRDLDEIMMRVASNPFCVLFIDEIHGLPLDIEESLYKAMQDFEYDITLTKEIVLGDGFDISLNEERGVQTIKLPKYTLMGATTLMGKINKPLKDRFPIRVEMDDYNVGELVSIIDVFTGQDKPDSFDTYIGQTKAVDIIKMHIKSAMYEGSEIVITNDAKQAIAELSMRTARLVKQRSKNCIAYARSIGAGIITPDMVETAMELFGVDSDGLDRVHRDIISHMVKQKNKPIGSQALAEAVNVTKYDIEAVYVPELTKIGFMTRDGRSMKMLTEDAYERFGAV